MSDKSLLTRLGETIDQYRRDRKAAQIALSAQEPSVSTIQRWRWFFPTPGNIIFTLLLIASLLWAQNVGAISLGVPPAATTSTAGIPYQGRLANSSGQPLTQTVNMIFRLYSAASGGSPLWEEQWTGSNSVQVSDGLFNVMLGSLTPVSPSVITGNANLFLGITVGTDSEMSPRVQLGSVPFAIQALTVPDGSITTTKLASDIQFIPSGAIIMWNGAISAIPGGWQLCDGTGGTPNLTDRFIVGAGSSYAVGATGGAAQVTLTIDQIPAHTHSYSDKYTDGNRDNGSHAWNATNDKDPRYVVENKITGATGGNQPHENRPPYYALAFICKL
jgi:hypothetical protein